MKPISSRIKNLNSMLLLRGLTVLILASCATPEKTEPLSPEFRQFLGRWGRGTPLCAMDSERFSGLVIHGASGSLVREPQKIVAVFEALDWKKERVLRAEAVKYIGKLPPMISRADRSVMANFTNCQVMASFEAVSALVKFETSQAQRVPDKRTMKVIEHYVDPGPALSLVSLLLQWSVLRELSISPYYASRLPAPLASEMDRVSDFFKAEREKSSDRHESHSEEDDYIALRKDRVRTLVLQKTYDAMLTKLRPIFFH